MNEQNITLLNTELLNAISILLGDTCICLKNIESTEQEASQIITEDRELSYEAYQDLCMGKRTGNINSAIDSIKEAMEDIDSAINEEGKAHEKQ